jgi:uncharacterized protein
MGIGVGLAAVPVFLYEGSIALVSHLAGNILNVPSVIACVTATGGLMIIAIGFNMYGLKKIAVANLLPAIIVAPVIKIAYPLVMHCFHAM